MPFPTVELSDNAPSCTLTGSRNPSLPLNFYDCTEQSCSSFWSWCKVCQRWHNPDHISVNLLGCIAYLRSGVLPNNVLIGWGEVRSTNRFHVSYFFQWRERSLSAAQTQLWQYSPGAPPVLWHLPCKQRFLRLSERFPGAVQVQTAKLCWHSSSFSARLGI